MKNWWNDWGKALAIAYLVFALAIVGVCYAAGAEAGEWRGNLNIGSHHFHSPPAGVEWNERNYGLGIEYHSRRYFGTIGYYNNSFGEHTNYVGFGAEISITRHLHTGVELGLATGYEDWADRMGMTSIGQFSVIGDAYISIGDTHRLKFIFSPASTGAQYQIIF